MITGNTEDKTYEPWWWDEPNYDHGSRNLGVDPSIHIMNKNESKMLRKLKKDTGMSEEDIRAFKKYRIMLSKAQKSDQKSLLSKEDKARRDLMKRVTKELKLAKEHPDCVARFNHLWKEKYNTYRMW